MSTGKSCRKKQDRYYFKDSILLGRGELYISALDLNIEKGQVEIPYRPTIRFAMPVYDRGNKIRGVIVLNYMASNMIAHFDEMLAGSYGHIALLNQDGYWLRSHKPEREWAFMFKREINFRQKHEAEWQEIAHQEMGQIHSDDGLFTYVTIYPLRLIGGYAEEEVSDEHQAHHHVDPTTMAWKIISDVPGHRINQIWKDLVFGLPGMLWLMLVIMGVFTSWYFSLTYLERRRLREQVELHAKIYGSSTDGIIITDASEKIVDINSAFSEISGFTREESIGNKPSIFSSGKHDQAFYDELWRVLDANGFWEGEIYNRHKNGSIYTEWIRISAIKNDRGVISNYIALVSDITHKKSTEEQLLKYAHHDPLTGAHNRLSFNERFKHDLLLAKRNNGILALIYFDLDEFKPINDTCGHQAGDQILKTVSDRIVNSIRDTDILARVGGDEFVVVLSQIQTEEDAEKVANSLRYLIREPVKFKDLHLSVDVSVGVAIFPRDGSSEHELLEIADKAMYEHKHRDTE